MWMRCALQAMVAYAAIQAAEGKGAETPTAETRGGEGAAAADRVPESNSNRPPAAETDGAVKQLTAQIKASPRDWRLYYVRGQLHRRQRQYELAVADFTAAIELEPREAMLYEERGSAQFCLGKIEPSIADFDREIGLNPQLERGHWKRGISYYYAGKFAPGQKQFEAYQTYDDSDVENAVWRFLCMVPQVGLQKSQAQILKVGRDNRVPMREIYELYAGRLKPDDVLTAAKAGDLAEDELHHRLFYAHLYLGLYHEVVGNKQLAAEHLAEADKRQIAHYMWDVAHVHGEKLKKTDEQVAK